MWMLIVMTCLQGDCNSELLSHHKTQEDCVKYMQALELKDGSAALCIEVVKEEA